MLFGFLLFVNCAIFISGIDVIIVELVKGMAIHHGPTVDEQWKEIQRLRSMPRETSDFDPSSIEDRFFPEVTQSYRNVK